MTERRWDGDKKIYSGLWRWWGIRKSTEIQDKEDGKIIYVGQQDQAYLVGNVNSAPLGVTSTIDLMDQPLSTTEEHMEKKYHSHNIG